MATGGLQSMTCVNWEEMALDKSIPCSIGTFRGIFAGIYFSIGVPLYAVTVAHVAVVGPLQRYLRELVEVDIFDYKHPVITLDEFKYAAEILQTSSSLDTICEGSLSSSGSGSGEFGGSISIHASSTSVGTHAVSSSRHKDIINFELGVAEFVLLVLLQKGETTPESIEEIKASFYALDKNKKGKLGVMDLSVAGCIKRNRVSDLRSSHESNMALLEHHVISSRGNSGLGSAVASIDIDEDNQQDQLDLLSVNVHSPSHSTSLDSMDVSSTIISPPKERGDLIYESGNPSMASLTSASFAMDI